jgi:ABC-type amino acid transport system permease subunit
MRRIGAFLGKISLTLAVLVITFWPVWGTFVAWILLEPSTFWQKLALVTVALVIGLPIQFWMVVLGLGLLSAVWD